MSGIENRISELESQIVTLADGEPYVPVAVRLRDARKKYRIEDGWQIISEITFSEAASIVRARAMIINPKEQTVATGTAEEVRGSTDVNTTSAVENAETSAVGRALGFAGLGNGQSYRNNGVVTIRNGNGRVRQYELIWARIVNFRKTFRIEEGWQIVTEVSEPTPSTVLVVAKLINPQNKLVATGTAEEVRRSSDVNTSSAVENAETSAVGRLIYIAGYGNGEFCTAEELTAALKRQKELETAKGRKEGARGKQQEPPKSSRSGAKGTPAGSKESLATPRLVNKGGVEFQDPPALPGIEYVVVGDKILVKEVAKNAVFKFKSQLEVAGFSWSKDLRGLAKDKPQEQAA